MDPTAPGSQDPQNPNPANHIRSGQFVVAGEDTATPAQNINPDPKQPAASGTVPPTLPSSPAADIPPQPVSPPAMNPEDLLASLAKQTEGAVLPQNNQDIQQPSPFPPSPTPEFKPPVAQPASAEPVLNLASEIPAVQSEPQQTVSLDILPQTDNSPPDPTPYAPPTGGPPPSQEGSRMDKIKVTLMVAGILVLVGLISSLAWFFVLNKPKDAAKTEIAQDELIEDLPAIPKRTQGGFGDLPTSTSSSTLSSPSPSPSQDDTDITIPDLTGL